MAENIEELKLTIDSVITSNGSGQITGQGLNIVLNDMCDVLGSTGGGGSVYICAGDSFEEYIDDSGSTALRPTVSNPENLALNKIAYDAITAGVQNKSIPLINISLLELMKAHGYPVDDVIACYISVACMIQGMVLSEEYITEIEGLVEDPLLYLNTAVYMCVEGEGNQVMLFNDGKVILVN